MLVALFAMVTGVLGDHSAAYDAALPALKSQIESEWCARVYEPFFNGSYSALNVNAICDHAKLEATGLVMRGKSGFLPELLRMWRTLIPFTLDAIRSAAHVPAHWKHERGHAELDVQIYTFGVWFGNSLYYFRKQYPNAVLRNFDSFLGLPPEQSGQVQRSNWKAGAFGASSGLTKPNAVMARLYDDLGGEAKKSITVRGFYNETLTAELAATMAADGPATIVDVDSDIYISAVQALDWLFANRLVRVGTLITYDDFMDYACTRKIESGHLVIPDVFEAGEPKAHREISQKYAVDFRCVAGACAAPSQRACDIHAAPFGAIFVVANIGGTANDGFEMDKAQFEMYARRNSWCSHLRRRHRTWVPTADGTAKKTGGQVGSAQ